MECFNQGELVRVELVMVELVMERIGGERIGGNWNQPRFLTPVGVACE